jgi:hypothetical protein
MCKLAHFFRDYDTHYPRDVQRGKKIIVDPTITPSSTECSTNADKSPE